MMKMVLVDENWCETANRISESKIYNRYKLTLNKVYIDYSGASNNNDYIFIYDDESTSFWAPKEYFKSIEDIRDEKLNILLK